MEELVAQSAVKARVHSAEACNADMRLLAGPNEFREHFKRTSKLPYAKRLADFHLLLYLAGQANFEPEDIGAIAAAAKDGQPIPEGYSLIIDSLAMG